MCIGKWEWERKLRTEIDTGDGWRGGRGKGDKGKGGVLSIGSKGGKGLLEPAISLLTAIFSIPIPSGIVT